MRVVDVFARGPDAAGHYRHIVMLREVDGGRYLPIWVGQSEGAGVSRSGCDELRLAMKGCFHEVQRSVAAPPRSAFLCERRTLRAAMVASETAKTFGPAPPILSR
jgi:hypothetical protein